MRISNKRRGNIRYIYNSKTLSYEKVESHKLNKGIFKLLIIFVLFSISFGYFFVQIGKLNEQLFINTTGIIGVIASIVSLFTFFSNPIDRKSFEALGTEYMKGLVDTAEKLQHIENDLQNKEKQLGVKDREIKQLELKKAEVEFIVRKISMSFFFKDQLSRIEGRIVEITKENKELNNILGQRESLKKQLGDLNEDIEKTTDSKIVEDITSMIITQKKEVLKDSPKLIFKGPFGNLLNIVMEILTKISIR